MNTSNATMATREWAIILGCLLYPVVLLICLTPANARMTAVGGAAISTGVPVIAIVLGTRNRVSNWLFHR